MHEDLIREQEEMRRRMEELFRNFYNTDISAPSFGHADNHERAATFASNAAHGGKHDHKD